MSAALLKDLRTSRGEETMRSLYRTYGGELYGFALNCLGDRGLAEEVVQDVFTRVWRHADSFDPDRASFRTWIYRIARNALIDLERRRWVRLGLAAREGDGSHVRANDDAIERAVLGGRARAALARLTPEHRQVIRLAPFQGMRVPEIDELTGLPL